MKSPIRRNRNIGTSKQGYSQDNRLVIADKELTFYENLINYKVINKTIKGHNFKFVVERTRKNSFHACTISDIEFILEQIPKEDFGKLTLIVLRQPKRKEEILRSVWGRLCYSFEFEGDYYPAIIIEAMDVDRKMKWSRKLTLDDQKEIERLKNDGHEISLGKRYYEADYTFDAIRSTQLYRTLPHEFGHYVHYLNVVLRPVEKLKKELDKISDLVNDNDTSETNKNYDRWDKLFDEYHKEKDKLEDLYFSIPSNEKEVFAHKYADNFVDNLNKNKTIPFDRVFDENKIKELGLNLDDFLFI